MLSSDKSNIFVSMKVQLASVYEKILSSMKVTFSRGLILKSIVCCVCVMFSSDVSWGMNGDDNEINDKIPTYKVVLLGNSQVGKTQIINKKQTGEFDAKSLATAGVGFNPLGVKINQDKPNQNIKLRVWDTAGQEKFKSLILNYVKQVHAFVLVYDITNKESFNNIPTWMNLAQTKAPKEAVYFLVGNKADMDDGDGKRQVTTDEALNFAKKNNMRLIEVSAFNGQNINELFEEIANACAKNDINEEIKEPIKNPHNNKYYPPKPEKNDIQISTPSKNKRCNCCPCNKDEDE